MEPFTLKCNRADQSWPNGTFFIQSRGNNAGYPSYSPISNCYRFSSPEEDSSRYYWLVYAIWETGGFRPLLKGSLIPFIRIGDARDCIAKMVPHIDHVERIMPALQHLRQLESELNQQLRNIRKLRPALMQKARRPSSPLCGAPSQARG